MKITEKKSMFRKITTLLSLPVFVISQLTLACPNAFAGDLQSILDNRTTQREVAVADATSTSVSTSTATNTATATTFQDFVTSSALSSTNTASSISTMTQTSTATSSATAVTTATGTNASTVTTVVPVAPSRNTVADPAVRVTPFSIDPALSPLPGDKSFLKVQVTGNGDATVTFLNEYGWSNGVGTIVLNGNFKPLTNEILITNASGLVSQVHLTFKNSRMLNQSCNARPRRFYATREFVTEKQFE